MFQFQSNKLIIQNIPIPIFLLKWCQKWNIFDNENSSQYTKVWQRLMWPTACMCLLYHLLIFFPAWQEIENKNFNQILTFTPTNFTLKALPSEWQTWAVSYYYYLVFLKIHQHVYSLIKFQELLKEFTLWWYMNDCDPLKSAEWKHWLLMMRLKSWSLYWNSRLSEYTLVKIPLEQLIHSVSSLQVTFLKVVLNSKEKQCECLWVNILLGTILQI